MTNSHVIPDTLGVSGPCRWLLERRFHEEVRGGGRTHHPWWAGTRSTVASLGYPGDICVVRNENAVDAVTCNNFVAGIASQTGRYGPNWYWNDQPCRPAGEGGDAPGCKQHPTNQFMVFAFGPGIYSACGDGDRVCFGIEVK